MSFIAFISAVIALLVAVYLNKQGVKRGDGPLAGVCGGIASHYDLPPNAVRIAWILSGFFGGFGLALYIFCYFILKE